MTTLPQSVKRPGRTSEIAARSSAAGVGAAGPSHSRSPPRQSGFRRGHPP